MPKRNGQRVWSKKYTERYYSIPEHIRAIIKAIQKENLVEIKEILNQDKDFNLNFLDGTSPIIHAVISKNIDILKLFLEYKSIDINNPDLSGCTALDQAILNNDIEMAKLLIKFGATPNTKDINNNSVLDDAIKYSSIEILSLLLEKGANPFLINLESLYKDVEKLKLIELSQKKYLSLKTVSACAILFTAFRPKSVNSSSTLQKLPFEINMLIASFLLGDLPKNKIEKFNQVTNIPKTDSYSAFFLYKPIMKSYDLRKLQFFTFMMEEKINIINLSFAKQNLQLAWKLIAGFNNVISENDNFDITDYEPYYKNPWDIMDKYTKLGVT